MQLFTENTITTVVPLFKPFTLDKLLRAVGRCYAIVILCNIMEQLFGEFIPFLTTDLFKKKKKKKKKANWSAKTPR